MRGSPVRRGIVPQSGLRRAVEVGVIGGSGFRNSLEHWGQPRHQRRAKPQPLFFLCSFFYELFIGFLKLLIMVKNKWHFLASS